MQRNPAAVWLFSIITFGAYGVWWVYKTNDEMRSRGEEVRPALSALAASWGVFLILPALWCAATTAVRVRSQCRATGTKGPNVALALVLVFVFAYIPYVQVHLNRLPAQAPQPLPE